MRITQSRALSLALLAAIALPVTACARHRTRGDLPYVARDVGTLYSAARARLDQGRYKEAAQLFDEVERQHPYSVWARRAQLMSAFSYYLDHDYTNSIQSAQRFLSVHPGNRDAPYAYYLVSLGYYEQIQDVTRDQKITRQALDALGELTRRYPTSRYAADARLKIDLVNDHLAGKEMEVGRFYERRGQWLAASMRFRAVIDTYQTTTHTPEALMRLTECYLNLGVPMEAQRSAAVLGRNYPGTQWYRQAFRLMGQHPASDLPAVGRGVQAVPPGTPGARAQSLPGDAGTARPGSPTPAPGSGGTPPTPPAGGSTMPTPATTGSEGGAAGTPAGSTSGRPGT
ncbi:outer membrane protein assembly factor BamD [Sphingomonas sp.]|uniref:outer membrane protein assembly factor BamD n=1 Tax=Sphingomonas sp. TaxID=28214 RepID=UPI003CC5AADE